VIGNFVHTNINSLAAVPWMSKNLFEVRDHKFNYFVVRDSIFTKKREVMMPDQLHRLSGNIQVIFIGSTYIAVPVVGAN
jgi:hypothetical protein